VLTSQSVSQSLSSSTRDRFVTWARDTHAQVAPINIEPRN
jgi:hypothetical protein